MSESSEIVARAKAHAESQLTTAAQREVERQERGELDRLRRRLHSATGTAEFTALIAATWRELNARGKAEALRAMPTDTDPNKAASLHAFTLGDDEAAVAAYLLELAAIPVVREHQSAESWLRGGLLDELLAEDPAPTRDTPATPTTRARRKGRPLLYPKALKMAINLLRSGKHKDVKIHRLCIEKFATREEIPKSAESFMRAVRRHIANTRT